jgi:nitroreductase
MNTDDLRGIVEIAVQAPSVHNTQPWRFAAHQDDKGELDGLDVFTDTGRLLGVIDPSGRELHVSCGAAIEFARVGARKLGYSCTVHLFPDMTKAELVARVEIGGPEPPSADELALASAVSARHTERERFEERPVPAEVVEQLRLAAASVGTWIRVLDQPGDEVTAAVLLARADEIERADPSYDRELADWRRADPAATDGIVSSSIPSTPVESRASSFRLRDFAAGESAGEAASETGKGDSAGEAEPVGPPPAEHPLVVILGTEEDDPHAWLQAGQALGSLLLRATVDDVSASPMTQVLEVPATRLMLAKQLGLVGHPQMLLRLGYGHSQATTPRRPIEEVFTEPQ